MRKVERGVINNPRKLQHESIERDSRQPGVTSRVRASPTI
jgi:hypothetical protein